MKPNGKPRGSYARRACNHCRQRKSRCDGQEPICGPCRVTGHECTWGPESAKKPNTRQYVEMLKNRIKVLEINLKATEDQIAQSKQSNGSQITDRPSRLSLPDHHVNQDFHYEELDESPTTPDQDSDLDQLCTSSQQLVLQDTDLQVFGPTSVYRLSPNSQPPSRTPKMTGYYQANYDRISDERWRRHLPPEVPLDQQEHDFLLDLLFKFFTSWCMRVVPELFLRDMHLALSVPETEETPKTQHYSPMLHNALLALALAFSDKCHLRDVNTRRYFAKQAKSCIENECERPNISVVHGLSLIGSFHSTQGEQTLGYLYFGMSGRMSQALGLSVDCSPWVKCGLITDGDMLARNWAYWTTFSQDVCWSLHVGREFCVSEPSDKQTIPVPFVDSEFDQIPWTCPEPFKVPTQPSLLSSTFAASCELLRIARRIMEMLNGLNIRTRYETQLKLISEIDLQLNAWKDSLAKDLDLSHSNRPTALPHRLMLHAAYWWLFILLHRPFYRRARPVHGTDSQDLDHVKLCNAAANEILKLLETWSSLYSLRYVPITLIQVMYSAGTIFVLSSVQAMSRPRLAEVALSKSVNRAEQCIQYLLETGKSWECGNQIAGILSSLLQKQLRARLEMRAADRSRVYVELPSALQAESSSQSARSQLLTDFEQDPVLEGPSNHVASDLNSPGPFSDMGQYFTTDFGHDPTFGSSRGMLSMGHPYYQQSPPVPHDDAMLWPNVDYGGIPDMGLGMLSGEPLPRQPYTTFTSGGMSGIEYGVGDSSTFEQHHALDLTADDVAFLEDFVKQQEGSIH